MKNIPQKIYLQLNCPENVDFKSLEGITWDTEPIFRGDLEFISVDFLRGKMETLKEERLKSFDKDDESRRAQIKLLNDLINEASR